MYNYSPYYDYDYGYGYEYDLVPDIATSIAGGLLIFILLLLMAVFVIGIVRYLLEGFALYNIAKRRGMKNPFFAFIPVVNTYLLGLIHDDINRTMNKQSKNANTLLILKIATIAVDLISIPFSIIASVVAGVSGASVAVSIITSLFSAVSFVLLIILSVFSFISLYAIFKEYDHEHATLYIVLSVISGVLGSVFLFVIRNKPSGYELWLKQREEQQRAAAENKFEEVVAEESVEEVFSDIPVHEEQDQTIIEQPEEQPSAINDTEPDLTEND